MPFQVSVLDEIDELLSARCRTAQVRLEENKPGLIRAIEYNDRLAGHWQPGIKTRSSELEEHELRKFMDMMRSDWLRGRRHPSRPKRRALIIDLGAGNGKVVDWIAALVDETAWEVSYVFTDISPRMMEGAEKRFAMTKAERPGARMHGHFTLCDITEPMFSAVDWAELREAFFPIVTICAGGTIGNFGEVESADDSAQDLVFEHYVRPADAALVTFLDPARIKISLEAYRSSGTNSGMYDGQVVNAYVYTGRENRLQDSWVVPFTGNGKTHSAMDRVIRGVEDLEGRPFWMKLDMTRNGLKVGQVTRHYSEDYARTRFLGGMSVLDVEPNGRAYTITFGDGSPGDYWAHRG